MQFQWVTQRHAEADKKLLFPMPPTRWIPLCNACLRHDFAAGNQPDMRLDLARANRPIAPLAPTNSARFHREICRSVDCLTLSRFLLSFGQTAELYYGTLLHELAHSTGHSKRLDRGLDTELRPFGSPDYGKEELVAEMAAAFLCAHAGIKPATIENQAAYIGGWLKQIKGDKRLVVTAAGKAQAAADWIRGERKAAE